MTDFRERYKRAGFGREDMTANRALRSIRRDEARREMRDEQFSFLRRDFETAENDSLDVPENHHRQELHEEHEERGEEDRHEDTKSKATTELEIAVQKRLLQLEKWREERNRKKLADKKKAKPAFKVGVVHHKIYSPPINKEPVPPPPPKLCRTREVHPEPLPKRVTRATEKRLAVKAVTNQQKRENLRFKKTGKVESTTNDDGSHNVPFAPKDYMFRPPVGVTPLPLFGRQALEATRINDRHIESDSKITSTSSELPTILSIGSESVSTDRDNSTSKSSSRRSRIHRSNHSRDITTAKDNAKDSTAETIALKLSTDDAEVLNDQDYLTFNGKIDTSFTKYKKSSPEGRRVGRIFTPPVTSTHSGKENDLIPKNGRMAENSKQKKSRRSSKISTPPVEPSSTVESQDNTVEDQEMMEVQVNTSITKKVTLTRQDAIQSPASKTRSSRMFTPKHSSGKPERATTNDEEMMDTQDDADVNPSNYSVSMDSTFSKRNKTKSPGNRRRSSKMFTDEMVNPEKTSALDVPTQEDAETLDEQENNKSSSRINFSMDSSVSKQNTTQSPATRRSSKMFPLEAESPTPSKEVIFKEQQVLDEQEDVHSMETNILKKNTRKSLGRRRSTKLSSQSSVEEPSPVKSTSFKEPIRADPETQETDVDIDNNSAMDTSLSKHDKTKSLANHHRSTRTSLNESPKQSKERSFKEQQVLGEQEDVHSDSKNVSAMETSISKKNTRKSLGRRRSTKLSSQSSVEEPSPAKSTSFKEPITTRTETQEVDININNNSAIDTSISKQDKTKSSANHRRSTRTSLNESPKQSKERSLKEQQVLGEHEDVHSDSKNVSAMETNISKKNTKKSLGRRRSTKLSSQSSVEEPSPAKSTSFKEPITTHTETQEAYVIINNNSDIDTSISKQDKTKSSANQRRSTRMSLGESSPEKSLPAKESSFTLKDQNLLENQENVNSNSPDLMGSFIAPLRPRKSTKMINLLEQSITGYSPRRSSRPPARRTEVPVDQSLIKFSPPRTETLNESSSSEPTKHKSPNKSEDNSQNFSLNMSLDKDSTPTEKPPAFFSPYIVASRGKSSMRKEVQKRRFSQPAPAEIPTKETIMQTLNISVEEEERTSQYYKYILDKEIERLTEICDKWDLIKNEASTPEDIHYEIQAAVGQTHLLIRKKFERFRSLVLDCETGKGEMLVTCKDLQGFWEMMYMEIKNCDSRFARLEEKRMRGWPADEEEQPIQQPKKKLPAKKAGPKKKPAAAAAKSSSLRALIMAARKKKTEAQEEPTIDVQMIEASIPENSDRISDETASTKFPTSKTETPDKPSRRTSTPKSTSKWESLLKKVQMSQARKSTTSPLIVMKLSQMCKTPEVELDNSIVYINSGRTPAKSILKSANDTIMNKSMNKVFFTEQPPDVQEFEHVEGGNNDDDMSIDNSEEPKRKLDFENESFNLSHADEDRETAKTSTKTIPVPPASDSPPAAPKSSNPTILVDGLPLSLSPLTLDDVQPESAMKKGTRRTKKQISFQDSAVDDESHTRLRKSTKFGAPLTPRPKSRENSMEDDEVQVFMEVDEDQEKLDDTSFTAPEQNVQKELYLNSNGIITERIVPVTKATPRTARLKRSCSERSTKTNVTVTEDVTIQTPSKARLRRRNTVTPGSMLNSPKTSDIMVDDVEFATPRTRGKKSLRTPGSMLNTPNTSDMLGNMSLESATPKTRGRKSLKRSIMDSTSVDDDVNVTVDDATAPKLRRTPKIIKNKIDPDESIQKSASSKARKSTKTLNVTKNDTELTESIEGPATPKLRRKNSKLDTTKSSLEVKSTPSLRRKSSKKLQENIEPNEQKTDQEMNESTKVSRTPSLRGRKKNLENVESTDQTVSSKDVSEAMTPNTRRKSTRRAHISTKSED